MLPVVYPYKTSMKLTKASVPKTHPGPRMGRWLTRLDWQGLKRAVQAGEHASLIRNNLSLPSSD
jgi:hypothetical protein